MSDQVQLPDFLGAAVIGVQMAGDYLAGVLRTVVGVQCPIAGPLKRLSKIDPPRHSHEGEPPFKESGVGQASITSVPMENGAAIGPDDSQYEGGFNYMAHWDMEDGIRGYHHPWMATKWRDYLPTMDKIILRELKSRTGAR